MTQPGEGTEIAEGVDIHTTAGKVADLERRLEEAVNAGSRRAIETQLAHVSRDLVRDG